MQRRVGPRPVATRLRPTHGGGEQGRAENHDRNTRPADVRVHVDRVRGRVHIRPADGHVPGARVRVVRRRLRGGRVAGRIGHRRGRVGRHPGTVSQQRPPETPEALAVVQTDDPGHWRRRRAHGVRAVRRGRPVVVRVFARIRVEGRGQRQSRQHVRRPRRWRTRTRPKRRT